ncbi:unnamed protein product, partial [Staurois parvus]
MWCDSVAICHPGFSTRQVEGLQRVYLMQRKLAFQFPHLFVKSVSGSGAWRFLSDLGGMKSPILGPCFPNPQHTNGTGVCRALNKNLTMGLGSTSADKRSVLRSQEEVRW